MVELSVFPGGFGLVGGRYVLVALEVCGLFDVGFLRFSAITAIPTMTLKITTTIIPVGSNGLDVDWGCTGDGVGGVGDGTTTLYSELFEDWYTFDPS